MKKRSTFFESALSSRWDRQDNMIDLSDDEPAIFELYLRGVHFDDAVIRLENNPTENEYGDDNLNRLGVLYSKTYILADKLGDCATANRLLDAICDDPDMVRVLLAAGSVAYAWKYTVDGSPLRKLYLDVWVNLMAQGTQWPHEEADLRLPKQFLLAVLKGNSRVCGGLSTIVKAKEGDGGRVFRAEEKAKYHQYSRLLPGPDEDGGV